MSEMKCKRCGTDENRIDGFCSIECRDAFDYEEEIADLEARAEKAEAMVEKLIEAGRMMKQPETIEEFHRGRRDYNALVAKWKEQK